MNEYEAMLKYHYDIKRGELAYRKNAQFVEVLKRSEPEPPVRRRPMLRWPDLSRLFPRRRVRSRWQAGFGD